MAISLVSPEEEKYLVEIEKLINRKIPRETLPVFSSSAEHALRGEHHLRIRVPAPVAREPEKSSPSRGKRPVRDEWFNKPYEPSVSTALNTPVAVPVAAGRPARQVPALFMRKPPQTDVND